MLLFKFKTCFQQYIVAGYSRDGHRFFNEQNFLKRTKFSWKRLLFRKKRTMDE